MDTPEQIAERLILSGVYEDGYVKPEVLRLGIVSYLTAERQCADELTAHIAVLREALNEAFKVREQLSAMYHDWCIKNTSSFDIMIHIGALLNKMRVVEHTLSTTPAASLDALKQRVKAEAMEEAAKYLEDQAGKKCGCITQIKGVWVQYCDCQNGGDAAEAQSWCDAMNAAVDIRGLAAIRQRAQEGK